MKTRQKLMRIFFAAILLISSILCSGCLPFFRGMHADKDAEQIQVPPSQSSTTQSQQVTLYYRYADTDYLIAESREISLSSDKRIEERILSALIQDGPSSSNLYWPSNAQTSVVSISDQRGYLYVTLSNSFLQPSSSIPSDWENDPQWSNLVHTDRRLAVYCIVNSLTELGQYSRVQILIDKEGNGSGVRPTRAELGFAAGTADDNMLMEPIGRNSEIIMTPAWTAQQILSSYVDKNWENVLSFATDQDKLTSCTYTRTELKNALSVAQASMSSYAVTGETVSSDSTQAVVCIDYTYVLNDGNEYEVSNVPLRFILVDGIWKIVYSSLEQLINHV